MKKEVESGKIEIASGLVKVVISIDVIFRTTNLSIGEYDNKEKKILIDFISYKVGQRIKS
ncbi:MAG: hypothetical protein ACR5K2_03870 [Wolbachia sp.]